MVKVMRSMSREEVFKIITDARKKGQPPNLRDANLPRANLIGANLTGADVHGADLSGAHFQSVKNLNEVKNLEHAELSGVYVSGLDLTGTALEHAPITHEFHAHQFGPFRVDGCRTPKEATAKLRKKLNPPDRVGSRWSVPRNVRIATLIT